MLQKCRSLPVKLYAKAARAPKRRNQIVNSQVQVDGSLYFPSQELGLSGGTQLQIRSPGCAPLIAFKMLNAAQLQVDCDPDSVVDPAAASRARLAE